MAEKLIIETIERYVKYYNKQRPCYALGYDTPDNYYRRYRNGEIRKKNTFSTRELTEKPKSIQKRRSDKEKNE